MLEFMNKLKRAFNGNTEAPKPKPEPTHYDIGFSGTPAEAELYPMSFDAIKGATAALREGRAENIAAMLANLKESYPLKFGFTGPVIYHPRGQVASFIFEHLNASEIKQAVATLPLEQKEAVLGEALAHLAPGNFGSRMDALIGAGADVNYAGGLALRNTSRSMRTGAVQRLVNAGASFNIAIKTATARNETVGCESIAKRLKKLKSGLPYSLDDIPRKSTISFPDRLPAAM